MKISGRLIAAGVVAFLGAAPAVLAQGTITDAPATFVRGTSPWDSSPDGNFTGVSTPTTQDHLFETGWAFRVAGATQETFFPVPTSQNYTGAVSTHDWSDVGGLGLFSAQEVSVVKNTAGPSGAVTMTLKITNLSASTPLDINLFHMIDIDLQPTAGDDRAALLFRNNHIRITDVGANKIEYKGVGAKAYLVRPFGATDLGAVLSNATVDNFDNSGLPFGPGDFTGGFQWAYVIPASGSVSVTVVFSGNLSLVRGDFNDDSETDLVFRNAINNVQHRVWQMDGLTRTAELNVTPDVSNTNDRLVCTDDFTGDQKADLVFRDQTTNAVTFWAMGGPTGTDQQSTAPVGGTPPVLTTDWVVAACGDVNRDSKSDILWRNTVTQKLSVWLMNGTTFVSALTPTPDQAVNSNWQVTALLDYDADGNTDFLWYNTTSGNIVEWFMDPSFVRIFGAFTTPTNAGNANWKVVASGDYERGGRDLVPEEPVTNSGAGDIIWYNATSGRLVGWIMNGISANPVANARLQGLFACPTAVGATCNPADPLPPGTTDWVIVGPR